MAAITDLNEIQSTDSVKIIGADSTGLETFAVGADSSGNLKTVIGNTAAAPVPISAAGLPLPSGAATAANQTTELASLASIDTKTPLLVSGRQPVDGSGVIQPIYASSLPLPAGASTAALQTTGNTSLASIDAGIPAALGAATIAASMPVNIASDQIVPISASSLPLPTGAATAANQATTNASLTSIDGKTATLGQKPMAGSEPVVISSDQSAFPVNAQAIYNITLPTLANGQAVQLQTDSNGRLITNGNAVVVSPYPAAKVRNTQNIATTAVIYTDYTVTQTLGIKQFYAGGTGAGVGTLAKHDAAATLFLSNGDMESSGQVAAWAAVTGTFTSPTPDYSTVQKFTNLGSQRWTYSSSATALQRKQTFTTPQDFTNYRYVTARFFNDGTITSIRTISIIISSSSGGTRTYQISGTSGVTPFVSNSWVLLQGDLENPFSSTGTSFDLTSITDISIKMIDSVNKSGTVYWDTIRFEDSISLLYRCYFSASQTFSFSCDPVEVFNTGEKMYIIQKNTGANIQEYSAMAAGVAL